MKFKVPGDCSQITLRQFMAYHTAADDVERVMAIINKSRDYCESLQVDAAHTVINLFDEVIEAASSHFDRIIEVRGRRLGFLPDINSMTFREHVDLDQLAQTIWREKKSIDYTNLPQLMAVMFRPVTEQVGEYYNIQKYDLDNTEKYMADIMDLTLDRVNGALLFFFEYRRGISEQFSGLFGFDIEEGTSDGYTPSGLAKWGWYHVLESIANQDLTRHEEVLDKGAKAIFTHLSYMRDFQAEQNRIMKQAYKLK